MDLRQLRTFRAVVQHGSFTGAAAALGYTQSAVSQHVAALEASLGVRLFERRPFSITPAAARLAEHAANILVRVDVATSELVRLDEVADVRIAATPLAAATDVVARLLAHAHDAERGGGAVLQVADVGEVTSLVARGACEAGVVDGIVGPADPLGSTDAGLLAAQVLQLTPIGVMLPRDHPFAGRTSLRWDVIADARFIDAPRLLPPAGPGAAPWLDRRWARTRFDGTEPSALAALVGAGHGLAVVPVPPEDGRATSAPTVVVPLVDPSFVHRMELIVLRPRADAWRAHLAAAIA